MVVRAVFALALFLVFAVLFPFALYLALTVPVLFLVVVLVMMAVTMIVRKAGGRCCNQGHGQANRKNGKNLDH